VVAKIGVFLFADRREQPGFDPTAASSYESWDGCYVIVLRDGSRLEEVEIISSYTGAKARSEGTE